MLRLSNQLSDALFPIVVDCDSGQRAERLRTVFMHGTRLSLATVLPVAGGLALLAHPLLTAWIGPSFATTTTIVQILAFVVIVRVGAATSTVILKGAGMHRRLTVLVGLMAVGNLALSIALVRSLGLVGVALGTAVPVALIAVCGLVPTPAGGCRCPSLSSSARHCGQRSGRRSSRALFLVGSRSRLPATLPAVGLQLAMSTAAYFALFLIAVGPDGRREYLRHVDVLLKRTPRRVTHHRHGKCFLTTVERTDEHGSPHVTISIRQERLSHVRAFLSTP